jgi:GAF domain-containing protein
MASIVCHVAGRYGTSFAGLSIIYGNRQILIATLGSDITETPREHSFCATAIQRPGEPLIITDALEDERFAHLATVTGDPFVRFYAGAPIVDRNGYALGALCVADNRPRAAGIDPLELMMHGRQVERLLRW